MVSHAFVVSVLNRLRQEDWSEFEASWGYRGRDPFSETTKGGKGRRNRTGEKAVPEEETATNSVEMTKCEAYTHTKFVHFHLLLCMPCVLCVCWGGHGACITTCMCRTEDNFMEPNSFIPCLCGFQQLKSGL